MTDHKNRDDLSRFLVHLSRKYEGDSARKNLISILKSRRIEARNSHCLFQPKIQNIGFSSKLKKQFNTVCFTETPLNQLRHLVREIPGRQIQLRPYGLVFWKQDLLKNGANPAVYINAQTGSLRGFLLHEFNRHFENLTQYRSFRKKYGAEADSIIHYYSLVNIISRRIDFSWEREWRFKGHLDFHFNQLVAIILPDPDKHRSKFLHDLSSTRRRTIEKIPLISPEWSYEQLVEELTHRLWGN